VREPARRLSLPGHVRARDGYDRQQAIESGEVARVGGEQGQLFGYGPPPHTRAFGAA